MITIRKMQVKDALPVSRIEQEIFSKPWSYQGFVDALNLGNAIFFVAEEEGKIAGYIGMYMSLDEGEITNVAVTAKMRQRGIGGMLLSEMKKEAERRSIAKIILEVRVSNAGAIRLYERNGFKNCGVRKGFYELPKEDAYIMMYGQ
ncbi:MAG: ribosomal protein S18-alanine N-acetyltransferase [Clostridiales bacterium]|nr:ribosomal protein S18-alanine N-acetyltransferase [Clostridiales bacterium]